MEFSEELSDAIQYISELHQNEVNAAAVQMYLLIHRGCRDVEKFDKLLDVLIDADCAGEEHYVNLVKYVYTFDPGTAKKLYADFEDFNGFRSRILYAAISVLEEHSSEKEILEVILPKAMRQHEWYAQTVVILSFLVSGGAIEPSDIHSILQPVLDEFERDGSRLSYLVDKYDELAGLCKYPNSVFHNLSDLEWKNLEENVRHYVEKS